MGILCAWNPLYVDKIDQILTSFLSRSFLRIFRLGRPICLLGSMDMCLPLTEKIFGWS